MANINTYLQAILQAVYGEDVRGSIHDAIALINDVSEVVLSTGTAVTGPTSSSTGFFEDSLYLNINTYELWKCIGTDTWQSLGILKGDTGNGIDTIAKTSTSGLVDTYTITFTDGTTTTFDVTNGKDGTDGVDGSTWYKGTALTGTGTGITGFAGKQNDFYLNATTGMVYCCTSTGTAVTALWDYVLTLSGGGGSITVVNSLSSSSTTDALSAAMGKKLNDEKQPLLTEGYGVKIDASNNISANIKAGTNVNITQDPSDKSLTINSTGGSGGLLPYFFIESESGASVTVVNANDPTEIITPTAGAAGHWECEIPHYGVWVVHSNLSGQGDATTSVTVDDVKQYHINDMHYAYTINLTAPSGSTIRITDGVSETYTGTGTGSAQAFVVHQASTTYEIRVTLDGLNNTQNVTSPSATGGSTNVTIEFGTITVNVDPDFVSAGVSIDCTKGAASCTPKTAASTVTFRPNAAGTWVVSATLSGKTYTVNAEVTSLGTPVTVDLKTKALMYAFATCTDQQLADMLESYYNGAYDATDIALLKSTYMPIGAKRTIHLAQMAAGDGVSETHFDASGADYEYTIIGHEHDDLVTQSSGGKTKALLTLQQDRILYKNTTDATYSSNYPATSDGGGYMNSTNTNVGGWKNCVRRAWCNNTFKNALPAAIQALLKTVVKVTSEGNQSATLENTNDDVFFLSEQEIFGAKSYSAGNEGSQYEYYQTAANIAKKPSYQSYVSAGVWERSPYLSSAAYFCYVGEGAAANCNTASHALGLAPAFCI